MRRLLREPVIFDGRNLYDPAPMAALGFTYHGIGRAQGNAVARRVLITGGTGFLGTALCRALERPRRQVVALGSPDADLTRPDSLRRCGPAPFDRSTTWRPGRRRATSACTTPASNGSSTSRSTPTSSPGGSAAAAGQADRDGHQLRLRTATATLVEENYLEGQPIDSLFTYAMTKRMLYVGLRALHQQFGLRYLCLVPSTLYGPGYHTDGRQMHFIFDLIRKILPRQADGAPVVLWGDGHQRRELVYVDDFVRVLRAAGRRASTTTLVNIGAGEEFIDPRFAA